MDNALSESRHKGHNFRRDLAENYDDGHFPITTVKPV